MTLGKRLKAQRERKGWSQIYVAEKIGITNSVLSNYERDYRDPDTETLKKLASLYGVSIDFLLGNNVEKEAIKYEIPPKPEGMSDEEYGARRKAIEEIYNLPPDKFKYVEAIIRAIESDK